MSRKKNKYNLQKQNKYLRGQVPSVINEKHKQYKSSNKQEAFERDNCQCFFCNNFALKDDRVLSQEDMHDKRTLTMAHIFVWKKDGGKFVAINEVTLCRYHHNMMDFGVNCTREQQIMMLRMCQMYLTLTYMREIKNADVKGEVRVKAKRR